MSQELSANLNGKKDTEDEEERKMIFIQYRGVITDRFVQRLKETGAPIKPILTLRKIKTVMPSLKQKVDKVVTSNLIYKFKCPNCQVSYVGMTTRHLCTRVNEHRNYKGEQAVIRSHTQECMGRDPTVDDFTILKTVQGDTLYLSVREALFIRENKPELNTRDEFRGRELRMKI